jgi:hypothetical protein
MALIPGTLPSDTCYGTPQDLLELFAQYLDVPAFALNSKVVFSSANPSSLTADVVWFDTGFAAPASATNPILKITVSGGFVDYINNYATNLAVVTTPAAGDYLLISQSNVLKKITYSNITPASGSITYPMLNNGATEANNVAKRIAKAWVMFNGGNLTEYSTQSFNVSSIARLSGATSGGFRVSFTTAIPAANYAVLGTVGAGNEVWNSVAAACVRIQAATTGYVDFVTVQQNSNSIDFGYTSIAVLSS